MIQKLRLIYHNNCIFLYLLLFTFFYISVTAIKAKSTRVIAWNSARTFFNVKQAKCATLDCFSSLPYVILISKPEENSKGLGA